VVIRGSATAVISKGERPAALDFYEQRIAIAETRDE
jgi:hypothetical protein